MSSCTLHPPNRALLLTQLLGLETLAAVRRLSRRIGYRRPRPLADRELSAPDTTIAKNARALAQELSSPALANHCHRSFLFAVAIGTHRRDHFDTELLYIATMLHDLGLTPTVHGPEPFEVRGANAARDFCIREGIDPERADRVQEAIALHTSVKAAFQQPLTALVQLGAGADVIGYHIEDIAKETVERAVQRHPRLGLKKEVERLLHREAQQHPKFVTGLQMGLGFGRRIQQAPFAE